MLTGRRFLQIIHGMFEGVRFLAMCAIVMLLLSLPSLIALLLIVILNLSVGAAGLLIPVALGLTLWIFSRRSVTDRINPLLERISGRKY